MTIRILVCWEKPEEIDRASEVRNWIDKALDNHDSHSGYRTVNDPQNTFGIILPDSNDIPERMDKRERRRK